MFTDEAVYVHDDGASSATDADRQVLILRGKASLYRRYLPKIQGVARALLLTGTLLRASMETLLRRRDRTWRETWRRREVWRRGWPELES